MRILFLDVDGAPFLAYEMAALAGRGHEVYLAGVRPISAEFQSGEFAVLAGREIRLPWLDAAGLAAMVGFFVRRPVATLWTAAAVLAAHVGDPRALVKLLATLAWTFSLAHWADVHRIDHLHANWAHLPATSAWIISRLTGIPYSFSGHAGRDLFRTRVLLGSKLASARFAVVCNDAARRRLLEVEGGRSEKIHVCRHGVDLERFQSGQAAANGYLLTVGNLDAAKGFDVALHALAELRREKHGVRLRLVGEGTERKALEGLAEQLGVCAQADFSGRLTGDALVTAYRGARVLLAPSRILPNGGRDGLPNVLLEAMAIGVPVVGTAVAGLPEVIEDGHTGLLVPPEDAKALAAAIVRLLDDDALSASLAANARRLVESEFDRRRCATKFCALFARPDRSLAVAPRCDSSEASA